VTRRALLSCILLNSALLCAQQPAPYRDPHLPVDQRVQDLLGRMTLEEKATMLSGSGWMESAPIPRLGIPAIKMADGPMGIRNWTGPSAVTNDPAKKKISATAFPAGVAIAAAWDPELARMEGQAIGQEVASVGRDMILGPTVNIQRAPLWGRNFEGFGEDPYLAGAMAVAYIQGVQSEGIIATVKHFTVNNEEFERHRIDVAVSDRALHEIYFPAFEAAIHDGKVWSVMSSYNKVNGIYAAQSPLLKQELERANGFRGFIVSDWGSTYSTAPTVDAGMDIEMPGGDPMRHWLAGSEPHASGNDGGFLVADKVVPLVKSGTIPQANVDDNVLRILRILFESGMFDHPHTVIGTIDTPAQRAIARKGAEESLVLLKNENHVLPLDASKLHSIAVIGPNAAVARTGGGGSSLVYNDHPIAPLEALKERAGGIAIHYALGVAMQGEESAQDTPEARQHDRAAAVDAAKTSDVALVFVGYSDKFETEGHDRTTMDLPGGQDELIQAVAAANPRTIVIFNAGDPVTLTRWIERVPGVIDAFYGGEETGHAIAAVLFGDVDPGGKLPFSFIKRLEDSPASANYPGRNLHVNYAEGIYVGYRYFDKHPEVAPLFPFGFGLSYTEFAYSDLKLPKSSTGSLEASVTVRNTGPRAGVEVVQLYISDPHASVDRPVQELKGFRRVELAPGESKLVTFPLDRRALSFYSTATNQWVAEPGTFEVRIGSSSRDIRAKGAFQLSQ
jgi:beta-glucosidase